jgi:hypothetical protein
MKEIMKGLIVNLVDSGDEIKLEIPKSLWKFYGLNENTKPLFIQNENGLIIVLNKEESNSQVTVETPKKAKAETKKKKSTPAKKPVAEAKKAPAKKPVTEAKKAPAKKPAAKKKPGK